MSELYQPDRYQPVLSYIDSYWPKIIRTADGDKGTLIGLPGRFVVPNCDMFQEQYYWDSYFTLVGLRHSEHADVVVESTDNLVYLFDRFARIPNASRYYFLSRSQPPFLSSMVCMSYEILLKSDPEQARIWLAPKLEVLEKEYWSVWRGRNFPDHREVFRGLSRYYDLNIWHDAAEAESGWDMTPRFENKCLDFLPVDLNSLLYRYETDLAMLSKLLGQTDKVDIWLRLAQERKAAVTHLLWDEKSQSFYDYNYVTQKQSTFKSIASFFPLWAGLATSTQADQLVANHLGIFETDFGIVTSAEWHPKEDEVGKQWAWPNGWAPLTFITVMGLIRYGFKKEARRVIIKWLNTVTKVFDETGHVYEKYDVVHGGRAVSDRYPDQQGFGWTNGVYQDFCEILKDLEKETA